MTKLPPRISVLCAELSLDMLQKLTVPLGSQFLSVSGCGETTIHIWYRCIVSNEPSVRRLAVIQTGKVAPGDDGRYIGTVVMGPGTEFHVFEHVAGKKPESKLILPGRLQ